MFYIFSKIIGLLINPILWILTLLLCGLFFKKPPLKRKFYLSSIILILVFSNSFILNEVLRLWEPDATFSSELEESYDYGIVLSGMVWYDSETERTNFLQSSDRIWQAVRLYHEGKIKKIFITGGAAGFFEKDTIESILLKEFLIRIGIPDVDILTEEKSRNTRENAVYTAQILKDLLYKNLLLITSASHMKRAKGCFDKVGLKCDTFPVDHYSGARKYNFDNLFVPNARTLFNWNAFIHEIFGIVSYKISGYI